MDPRDVLARMSRPRRASAVLATLGLVLVLAVTLAACANAGAAPSAADLGGKPAEVPPGDTAGRPVAGEGSVAFPGLADLAERKIVKTGQISIEVPDVNAAIGDVRALALSLDGYVSGSQAAGERQAATLTLRVPADRFDEALERLRGMEGEVRVEATSEEDATASIVDLEARIRNLQASERQYRVLIERAEKVNDILAVQQRLDDVRGQIEQLIAQLKQLSGLAALSTVTVTLLPADRPVENAAEAWDPGSTFGTAIAALVSAGQALADVAIWLLIVGLPLLVILALALWLALRLRPLARRVGRATVAPED
jgi:hypothetical protein